MRISIATHTQSAKEMSTPIAQFVRAYVKHDLFYRVSAPMPKTRNIPKYGPEAMRQLSASLFSEVIIEITGLAYLGRLVLSLINALKAYMYLNSFKSFLEMLLWAELSI